MCSKTIERVQCPRCFTWNVDPEPRSYYNNTKASFCEACGANLGVPEMQVYKALRRLDARYTQVEAVRDRVIVQERINFLISMERLLDLNTEEFRDLWEIVEEQLGPHGDRLRAEREKQGA